MVIAGASVPESSRSMATARVSAGDQLLVGADDERPAFVGRHAEADAVGHGEVLVPAGLLHHADEVAGLALDLELLGEVDVEHDDADTAAERRARPARVGAIVGLQREHELARLESVTAGDDRVAVLRPLALADGPDDVLGVGPEARPDHRRHHLQLLLGHRVDVVGELDLA